MVDSCRLQQGALPRPSSPVREDEQSWAMPEARRDGAAVGAAGRSGKPGFDDGRGPIGEEAGPGVGQGRSGGFGRASLGSSSFVGRAERTPRTRENHFRPW